MRISRKNDDQDSAQREIEEMKVELEITIVIVVELQLGKLEFQCGPRSRQESP